MNRLFYGDNLDRLPAIGSESVDLVYLDPPFNSNAAYNLLYRSPTGDVSQAQYRAFTDTWRWGPAADAAFASVMVSGSPAAAMLGAFRASMQHSDMMAYLAMMTARLIEMRRVLKATGSLYLHCDSSASHYLKIVCDAIFGADAFRNEIVWKRSHAHSDGKQGAQHFGRVTDSLLFYSKAGTSTWNPQFGPYDQDYVDRDYRRMDPDGRRYRISDVQGPGGADKGNPFYEVMGVSRHWRYSHEKMQQLIDAGRIVQTRPGAVPQYKRYLDKMPGMPLQNLWTDLPVLNNRSREALGYPTQKPIALLERIIKASTNPGDLVLDPFCGCGTAIDAAQALGRRWIGIDITVLALNVVEQRLSRRGQRRNVDYVVEGVPLDMDGARRLWNDSPHQFQLWAVGLVGGQPRDSGKKGADEGVDGLVYFQEDAKRSVGRAIVSVKGGRNIHAHDIRDLLGTMKSQHASIGIFVTLNEPTSKMIAAAAAAGSSEIGNKRRSHIQIMTIDALLGGAKPDLPVVYDIIAAAAAARRAVARVPKAPPTPKQIRDQPGFKFTIEGAAGKPEAAQQVPATDATAHRPRRRASAAG